jgi:ribosomal protein S18 acetylase RimI-like enzyme
VLERRRTTVADEPFLRDLYASTRPDLALLREDLRAPFLAQQFEAQRAGYRRMFPYSEHDLIVQDGRPVGRVWVDWSETRCLIVDLAILPEYRRQGYGTQIVKELLGRTDLLGIPTYGHVERSNEAALEFWARLGFGETGRDGMYLEIGRPAVALHSKAAKEQLVSSLATSGNPSSFSG